MSQADTLKVGQLYREASIDTASTGTPFTIACRDADGNLNAGLFQGTATSSRYADLAEKYVADAVYEPGTVLMFGGAQEVTVATEDTARVAGVVSFNPGFIMNSQLECAVSLGEHTAVVALQGRVPVGIYGSVKKGDLMVSAGNGRAKAAENVYVVFADILRYVHCSVLKLLPLAVMVTFFHPGPFSVVASVTVTVSSGSGFGRSDTDPGL